MVIQHIIEDGQKRRLKQFVEDAVAYLKEHPEYDEVVQLADNISELENDRINRPSVYHNLPEGYEYNFSGFWGQVIGIGRTGIRELHKGERR